MVDEKKNIRISPSILSVPLDKIEEKIKKVEEYIDYIHIDVMDGKFVNNATDGINMFNEAKQASKKPLDVHLMVENPAEIIECYKGAEIITFHYEALKSEEEVYSLIEKIRANEAKVGISIKPNTSITKISKFLDKVDLVLIMTVEPGYGGQKLIEKALEKIKELRKLGFSKIIEIDGGVTVENSEKIRKTDVDIVVAGTAIFSAEDENEAINRILGK